MRRFFKTVSVYRAIVVAPKDRARRLNSDAPYRAKRLSSVEDIMEATQDSYLTAYRHLKLTQDGQGVLLVQMDDNGGPLMFTANAHAEVADAFCRISQDRANKIVILTGTGRDFMIGADWSSFPDVSDPGVWSQIHDEGFQVLENMANIRVPVIAAVEGGGGRHSGSGTRRSYLKAPEVTRRNPRVHFIQPLKERIVREFGYELSLEDGSAADLFKSIPRNG
jgi:hypothetical protein